MSTPFSPARRVLLAALLATPFQAALAADPAETFVSENIQKGLALLNNRSLAPAQKRDQFENFLTGLTDLKRIADFTLGKG